MLDLDATTILELPVDQLGLRILADFDRTAGWNSSNYVIEAQQYRGYSRDALRAISEAFAWLNARGLTARDPDQSSADAIFVTRMGAVCSQTARTRSMQPSDSSGGFTRRSNAKRGRSS